MSRDVTMVAIVGAGELGGAVAHALALNSRTGRIGAIRLIDDQSSVAAGKALDLRQSGPIAGFDMQIDGTADLAATAGASAIVLADPAGSPGEWESDAALALVRRLAKLGLFQTSIVICAGARQRDLMQRGFDELGLPRRRVIGSAPEALASAVRALVAIEARVSALQVTLSVMGAPPHRTLIPWADGSIAGHSAGTFLSPAQFQRLEKRLPALWPPGPAVLGTAAAQLCEAVVTESPRFFSAFVSLDRDNGTKAPVCAWPVAVGPHGIEKIAAPTLSTRDRLVIDGVLEGADKRQS